MARSVESFQVSSDIAELYESRFVPRLFGPWARHLVAAAGVGPGQAVLDVACGTGIAAREAAQRAGDRSRVVGLDLNPQMLAVAQRLAPEIVWRRGDAHALPFEPDTFDVVLCQAALMFFPDPAGALREMARVARREGTVALQVWNRLEAQPAYAPLVAVAARHAGPEAISLLGTYWSLGDLAQLQELLAAGGLDVVTLTTRVEHAPFDSIDELVRTEIESTPLVERISADVYRRILDDARDALHEFVAADGTAAIPLSGHIIVARRK